MRLKAMLLMFLAFFGVGILLLSGCYRRFVPTNPAPVNTPTPVFTAVPSPVPTYAIPTSGIFLDSCVLWTNGSASSDQLYYFGFSLSVNGMGETTATASLTTPEGVVAVPNTGSSGAFGWYVVYLSSLNRPYDPGQTYSIAVSTSLGMATASVVAPGGNLTVSPDGSLVSWTTAGNLSYVAVDPAGVGTDSYVSSYGIASPFSVPASAYPSSGQYQMAVAFQNSGVITNGDLPGKFIIEDQHQVMINR